MAPAYENQSTGQVIVSDEPRPDLEALSRWKQISAERAAEALAAAPQPTGAEESETDEAAAAQVAFIEEHDLDAATVLAILTEWAETSADAVETIPGTEDEPPHVVVGEPVTAEEAANAQPAVVTLPDGSVVGNDGEIGSLTEAPAEPKPRARRKSAEKADDTKDDAE